MTISYASKTGTPTQGNGAGEINLIGSPSESTNWTGTATIATDTTASNFPLQGAVSTAIKITSAVNAEYREYAFTVPAGLARKLKIDFWYKHAGTSTDWKIELYKSGVKQTLPSDSSSVSYLVGPVGRYSSTFDFDAGSYSLRIVRNGTGSMDIYVQLAIVGPGSMVQGAAIDGWQSYTPAWNGTLGNGALTGRWRRNGDTMEVALDLLWGSTTSTAATQEFDIPSGFTIDITKVPNPTQSNTALGFAEAFDNGGSRYTASAMYRDTNSIGFVSHAAGGPWTATAPFTWATGDQLSARFSVPISEWPNGTVNSGAGAQEEYVYNTSTSTTTSDSTSFATGTQGALIGSITATITRQVQLSRPMQSGDSLILEVSDNRQTWLPVGTAAFANNQGIVPLITENSTSYGLGIDYVSNTNFNVTFGQYANMFGKTTVGGAGQAWSIGAAAAYWRVRRFNPSSPVGFGNATALESGISSGNRGFPGKQSALPSAAGMIGERITGTFSGASISGAVNLTSFSITSGSWSVGIRANTSSAGTGRRARLSISTTSGTNDTNYNADMYHANTAQTLSGLMSSRIFDPSVTTTVYIIGNGPDGAVDFSSGIYEAIRIG